MSNQRPRVIGGSIWTSTDYLCWPCRLGWQGPGQPQTLHSILIITMHHQQIALTKRCPFSETQRDEEHAFLQIVDWNIANSV